MRTLWKVAKRLCVNQEFLTVFMNPSPTGGRVTVAIQNWAGLMRVLKPLMLFAFSSWDSHSFTLNLTWRCGPVHPPPTLESRLPRLP